MKTRSVGLLPVLGFGTAKTSARNVFCTSSTPQDGGYRCTRPGQGTAGIGAEIERRKVLNLPIYLPVRSALPHSGFTQGGLLGEQV